MTWGKVDDNFAFHPKALVAGNDALGLWVRSLSWSNQLLTDGFIPCDMVTAMNGIEGARRLVTAGLWIEVEEGYQFKDWLLYQPSRESVLAEREVSRKRMADIRAKKTASVQPQAKYEKTLEDVQPNFARSSDTPNPNPTRPVTSNEVTKTSFVDFWDLYPRKEKKPDALKSFERALKRAGLELILAGAAKYANDPNRDATYTKLPATWLNNDCWNDSPLPSRTPVNSKQASQDAARAEFLAATNQPQHEITANPDWA